MPRRYIKVYEVPPPGESIAIGDLDDRQPIATGDVPTAEWDVEIEDGNIRRMTGQQILDLVGVSPTPGGSGRPAEIEIEDTTDGIRIRGKSGDDAEFGPWFVVRDGRDGADVDIAYSVDGADNSWHETLTDDDNYIRFGKAGVWSVGRRFAGRDGTGGSGETIYPVSSILTPVASRLGLVTVSRLRFVLSRLNPVPAKLNGLPLSRLGESEFRRKLSNPYERKLRSG